MTKVSVIIPAFNESATIIALLEKVKAQSVDSVTLEIVVVDDGSRDNTAALLEARPDLYTHFVKQPRNQGKGAAVLAGLARVTGEYILFQDADLEYDPADYGLLFEPVHRFDADIVMGSRFRASRITRVSYYWHWVGNHLITGLFNLLNNTTFTDIYSCYLLYRRSLVNISDVKALGWDQQAEILSVAVRRAKAIYEVPINYYGRTYSEGKKIRGQHAISVIAMILKMRFSTVSGSDADQ